MKFLDDFNKYLNDKDRKSNGINKFDNHGETSEKLDPPTGNGEEDAPNAINEEFNASLIEFKIIVIDVDKDQVQANYAIFYNGKEFAKGQTILRRISEGNLDYYGSSYKLSKPEYPVSGTFDVHIGIKDAKKNAQLVAKIGNSAANMTGIFNTKLSERVEDTPFTEQLELNLGNFFAPNVDTIDEAKKNEIGTELAKLNEFFNKYKNALRKPGADIVFKVIGGASQVSTSYQGGNQKLAENRAKNLKNYMVQYFAQSNPDLSKYISQVAEVTTVMGQTPYIDVKTKYAGKTDQASVDAANKDNAANAANKEKYAAEQFVKVSIKAGSQA